MVSQPDGGSGRKLPVYIDLSKSARSRTERHSGEPELPPARRTPSRPLRPLTPGRDLRQLATLPNHHATGWRFQSFERRISFFFLFFSLLFDCFEYLPIPALGSTIVMYVCISKASILRQKKLKIVFCSFEQIGFPRLDFKIASRRFFEHHGILLLYYLVISRNDRFHIHFKSFTERLNLASEKETSLV